jgi:hypothetical protein
MAKAKSPLQEITFPIAGLNRNAAFQSQPPYTTPYCVNVRPFDVVNLTAAQMHGYRQRGGSRPGLVKAYAQRCGSGPIQMLAQATLINPAAAQKNILLAVAGGVLYQNATGSFASVTSALQTTGQLSGTQVGQKFYIANYSNYYAAGTNGTIVENVLTDPAMPDLTTLGIDTTKDFVWLSGKLPFQANIFPIASFTSGSITFTPETNQSLDDQASGTLWQIGRPTKVFDPASPTSALTTIMGSFPVAWRFYYGGTVTAVNGVVTLNGDATWEDVPEPSTTCQVTLELRDPITGIGYASYPVASIDSDTQLTLNNQTSDSDCAGVWYMLSWTDTTQPQLDGLPPLNCNLCCTYRGRLVLAGPGSVWYMSRIGNVNDWDYGADPSDPARAVGGTATTTGGVPHPITALMPHSDDYLIFGCERSLWLLNGDPAYGGSITALSREIGCIGPNAWCTMPDGSMMVMSRDGLYQVPPGAQGVPQSFSRSKLPAELLDIDATANYISMSYDAVARGIHLSVTPVAGTVGLHYFIDTAIGGFWPVTVPNVMQPTRMLSYAPDAAAAADVIFGSIDGYARKFSNTATDDDGTGFVSFVTYGPLRIAGPGYFGQLLQIVADLDANGLGVNWGIFQGDTAQDAVAAAVPAGDPTDATWTGVWAAGGNHRCYPRAYGAAHVIMIGSVVDPTAVSVPWAIEGLRIEPRKMGAIH